jgi:hypothetical protein
MVSEPQISVPELPFQVTLDNGLTFFVHFCEKNWTIHLSSAQTAIADLFISTSLIEEFFFFP